MGQRAKMVLGSIHGYALLVNFSYRDTKRRRYGIYECLVCGKNFVAREDHVKSGRIRSCGCFAKRNASEKNTRHGLRNNELYYTYKDMMRRCYTEGSENYYKYGGRGITVCNRWSDNKEGLKNFVEDMGDRPEGYQLDRINNDGPYSPENCWWASRVDQMNNRRGCVYVEYDGEIRTISEWSVLTGITCNTIKNRLRAGKKKKDLFVPVKERNYKQDSTTRLRSILHGVKDRCNNPKIRAYKNYGGRGIKVCEEWEHNTSSFIVWALASGYKACFTLDRIDNNGNYTPENCQWITLGEQQKNRRDTVYLTHKGKTMILADWAKELGVRGGAIQERISKGMPEDKIFYKGNLCSYRRGAHGI